MGRLLRVWTYIRRAHNTYFAFILSFVNFIAISYSLLLVNVFDVPQSRISFILYAAVFTVLYLVLATLVGRWDYRKGGAPVEQELAARSNPYSRDLAYALYLMADGRVDEAKQILKRWMS